MTYTDVNAVLPAKLFLAIASIVVGLVVIAAIWLDSWRLPGLGVALLVVCAIVVGGIYPAAVQRFQVKPSESSRERTYIERNIAATRAAYGLDDVDVQEYNAKTTVTSGPAAQRRRDRAGHPAARPRAGLGRVPPAGAGPAVLRVPGQPGRRPLRDRRQVPGHGGRRPRARAGRSGHRAAQLGQRPHDVHPRLRRRLGVRQPRETDGKPVFSEGDIPPTGAAGRPTSRGSTSASSRRTTRSSVRRRAPRRSSSTTRTPAPAGRRTTPTPARAASRSARSRARWPSRSPTRSTTSWSRTG